MMDKILEIIDRVLTSISVGVCSLFASAVSAAVSGVLLLGVILVIKFFFYGSSTITHNDLNLIYFLFSLVFVGVLGFNIFIERNFG